jgi:hypothetical protein
MIRSLLDLVGLPALDRMYMTSKSDDDGFRCAGKVTVDTSGDAGLLGTLLSVPPGEFRFGRHVASDDVVLVISISRVPERILALNDFMARPEIRQLAPMIPSDPLAMTAMWGVDVREDIFTFLTGEVDLVVFPYREGQQSPVPNMALVLGLRDGPAFREKLLGIMRNIMGEEKVAQITAAPGETVGDYTFYPLWAGAAYAVGPDFGIVTSDPEGMKKVVTRKGGDLSFTGSFFLHLNTDRAVDMAGTLAANADDPGAKLVADLLRRAGETHIGPIEIATKTGEGAWEWRASMPRSLLTVEYELLRDLVGALPEMRAAEIKKEALRGVVRAVDGALTKYGEEHGETFPATLDDLIEAGYLDAVPPTVKPTRLGAYMDDAYTYLAVRGEEGQVVGYYFFVYGLGEGTGFDVFTKENLADPKSFGVAADGTLDGVVSFAYGGTAIPQVKALFGD